MNIVRKRSITAFAAVALLGLCLGPAQAADEKPAGQPKIKIDEIKHDFGKSSPNTSLKHSFTFKNTGTGLLVIESVKAG
jgi:hypothetical protein